MGTWTAIWKPIKLNYYPKLCTKNNSKWIKDLNLRPETVKYIQDNIDTELMGSGLGSAFVNLYTKASKTKQNKNWLDKSFCTGRENNNKGNLITWRRYL